MNKILLAGVAFGLATIASPAAAQSVGASGDVDVTGTVAGKCTAANGLDSAIDLGELALSDGTVDSAFSNNTAGLTRSFTVRCTSADVELEVEATPLTNASANTDSGYTDTVHYTATLAADTAASTVVDVDYTTADSAPAASTQQLGDRLKNANDNVRVTVSDGYTTDASALLTAGNYSGVVTITVSPV